jgi:hypothetical protein
MEWNFDGPIHWALIGPTGDRRPVATVLAPFDMQRGTRCPLLGADVTIEGTPYRCVGVEAQQPNRPIARGEKIGLLLAPSPATPS